LIMLEKKPLIFILRSRRTINEEIPVSQNFLGG
jgi:hypothetical protein